MAEYPHKPLHVRAGIYDGWPTQVSNDSTFRFICGLTSGSQSHNPSAEDYYVGAQDAVGYSVSNNHNLPMPMHFHHPMRWPRNPQSGNYGFPSPDAAHVDFGSGLEPTNLESRSGAANKHYTETFKHQPTPSREELSDFDLRSQISGLWPLSLLSHCTQGFG